MERLKGQKISIGVQALGLSLLTCKLGIIPRLRAVMSACLKAQLLVRSHQNHSDYVCYFHPASSWASAKVGLSRPLPAGSPGETLNSCRKQGMYFFLFTTVPIWGMELVKPIPRGKPIGERQYSVVLFSMFCAYQRSTKCGPWNTPCPVQEGKWQHLFSTFPHNEKET